MKPLQSFIVTAKLPESISKLKVLAYNYRWCWNTETKELFSRIDRELWEEVNHNPVLLINKLPQETLENLAQKIDFTTYLDNVYAEFNEYMQSDKWFNKLRPDFDGKIAYFSPEFGINESFPNYSGGLGILAGDHLKSASDLGLPMVGVGLLYQQGYFRQHLTQNGWQNEHYHYNDFYNMPVTLMKDQNGLPLLIDVDLPDGKVYAQIWKLMVGIVPLYLMDTNIDRNENEEYRNITNQLYGGTRETRIQQEIILGIGGMRALYSLGIMPDVVHINEGHAAFALLERTMIFMNKYNLDFHSAKQLTKGSSVFTTHTPVPAGNEAFSLDRIIKYMNTYWGQLGLDKERFIYYGQTGDQFDPNESYSMTVLGLKFTAFHNGVSRLHGEVSRDMWHKIWKCFPANEVPIRHITNGVHTMTWVAREFAELFDRYLSPQWKDDVDNQEIWEGVSQIPAEEIWREKQRRRVRLVLFAREYLKNKQKAFLPPDQISKINEYLDPDALTIGFARRFATYKRAQLIFRDMKRLSSILKNPEKPVQILISGKAHPHDTMGKEMIQSIIQKVRAYGLERHVVFLEDYDMVIAYKMVKGCDVWLNNPIKPQEASGTSGMKAGLNGTVNFSILDGWWAESYDGTNGFAIGEGELKDHSEETEIMESEIIYDILENQIVDLFYDRDRTRVPEKWVSYMKNSIRTIAGRFSTNRMVKQYSEYFYMPAIDRYKMLSEDKAHKAVRLQDWKAKIRGNWYGVEIMDASLKTNGEAFIGKPMKVSALVNLGELDPEDVIVQVYYGSVDHNENLIDPHFENLKLVKKEGTYHQFEGEYLCPGTGKQGFTVRVLPYHEHIVEPAELYLCAWASK
ncbi:MAG: alpha-glucan family phosphorylase [Candidatus Kapaibacterium sp.]